MKCNRSQMADIMGIGLQTLDARVKEGLPYEQRPDKEAGTTGWLFDTVDVIDWLTGRIDGDSKSDEGKLAKVRISVADAGLKEIQLQKEMGLVVGVEDSIEPFEEVIGIIKSQINAVPGRVAQQVAAESDPAVTLRILKKEMDKAWTEANQALVDRAAYIEQVLSGQL